jgi:hypothetical protein
MSGVDLPTVKEILGHREIEMTLRYSQLAPAHKAKAVEQLGKAFQQIAEGQPAEKAEAVSGGQSPANLERFRNVLLVRSGRGLSVVSSKEATNQELNPTSRWWRRGESHFYHKYWCVLIIFTSKIRLAPTVAPRCEQL